jgi:hypothetical protein
MAKVEKLMNHGLLGPLETVDLYDPLVPLHDVGSSIQSFSKKSNSLKKLKRVKSFSRCEPDRIEKSELAKGP